MVLLLSASLRRQLLLALALVVTAAGAHAQLALRFTIDTSSFVSTTGQFAFDLIDADLRPTEITISDFVTTGVLGSISPTGDVSGQLPGLVRMRDTASFSEYLQDFAFGTFVTFTITLPVRSLESGVVPDALTFFLLGAQGESLVTTSDLTGANALFRLPVGAQPELYAGAGFSVSVQAVPEPSALALLACGLLLVMALSKRRRAR